MDLFGAAHRRGQAGPKRPSYAYPTIIKLGTVMPYLKKIQKTYKSLVTPQSFADMSIIRQKLLIFFISQNVEKNCILIH